MPGLRLWGAARQGAVMKHAMDSLQEEYDVIIETRILVWLDDEAEFRFIRSKDLQYMSVLNCRTIQRYQGNPEHLDYPIRLPDFTRIPTILYNFVLARPRDKLKTSKVFDSLFPSSALSIYCRGSMGNPLLRCSLLGIFYSSRDAIKDATPRLLVFE